MSTDHSDPRWAPIESARATAAPRCRSCNTQVTRQFARVFGDNRDVVHACPECSTYREMKTSEFIPEDLR